MRLSPLQKTAFGPFFIVIICFAGVLRLGTDAKAAYAEGQSVIEIFDNVVLSWSLRG